MQQDDPLYLCQSMLASGSPANDLSAHKESNFQGQYHTWVDAMGKHDAKL
jgi:hypothetical protein